MLTHMVPGTHSSSESSPAVPTQFVETRWSVVLNARSGSFEALEQLCHWYREPLRRHVLRRGFRPEDADDMIQDFLARKMIAGSLFKSVQDPKEVGQARRFRTFLLTCLDNFLIERRRKRPDPSDPGHGLVIGVPTESDAAPFEFPAPPLTNQEAAQARADWVEAVLSQAQERHRAEFVAAGKSPQSFQALDAYYNRQADAMSGTELARLLNMSENTFYVTKHRFAARRTYWLKEVVKETVTNPDDWEAEVRDLLEGEI